MLAFTVLTALAAPLEIAKIDTGMILPGRFMRRHRRSGHDYSEAFLHDLRFDEKGRPRREFSLNMPAYRDAKILVTDSDFGCGSSREGAVYAVMDYGVLAQISTRLRNTGDFRGPAVPSRHGDDSLRRWFDLRLPFSQPRLART